MDYTIGLTKVVKIKYTNTLIDLARVLDFFKEHIINPEEL
jgi:hypothetical protein